MKLSIRKMLRFSLGIVGSIVFIDGLYLILQNKIHLGTVLPLLIGIVLLIHAFFWQKISIFLMHRAQLKKAWKIIWMIFIFWLISLVIFFSYIQIQKNKQQNNSQFKAILVLGSGLINNQASPTLQARLDKAAEVYSQSPDAIIIVTGGLGYQQMLSEAEVMSSYLQNNFKIPTSNIEMENQSTSTELNLRNSQAILSKNSIALTAPIAIISSDFHTLRAKAIAQKQGYKDINTFAAHTPLETRYNAWLREYFAYISGYLLNEF